MDGGSRILEDASYSTCEPRPQLETATSHPLRSACIIPYYYAYELLLACIMTLGAYDMMLLSLCTDYGVWSKYLPP